MKKFHQSVLLDEVIDWLDVKSGSLYIDATVGGGGHTQEILARGGRVLALDRDPQAVEYLKKRKLGNLILVNGNFAHINSIAVKFGFQKVSGIIFDLGVSSHQLEIPQRGFSFQNEGPLDMRMEPDLNIRAFDLINFFDKRRLYEVIKGFGEEKLSRPIVDAIYSARRIKKIETTTELAEIVSEVYRKYRVKSKVHPATKTFQALRIVVNSELLNLEEALPQTVELLKKGGRLAIISFHSLEDGIVKRFFKQAARLKTLTKTPIGPGAGEIQKNPRSRSAKLRVAEKI